jgi:hypothetical protein
LFNVRLNRIAFEGKRSDVAQQAPVAFARSVGSTDNIDCSGRTETGSEPQAAFRCTMPSPPNPVRPNKSIKDSTTPILGISTSILDELVTPATLAPHLSKPADALYERLSKDTKTGVKAEPPNVYARLEAMHQQVTREGVSRKGCNDLSELASELYCTIEDISKHVSG